MNVTDIAIHELSSLSDAELLRLEDQAVYTRRVIEWGNNFPSNEQHKVARHCLSVEVEARRILTERNVLEKA